MTEEEKKAIEMLEYIGIRNTLMGCTFENRDYLARILLNLIRKKDTEINKLNNVIDKMVKRIKDDTEWFYSDLDNKREEEIKEYFMKEDK